MYYIALCLYCYRTLYNYICISSQNILLDSHGHAKIGDFGFSVELPKQRDGKSMFTSKMFARTEGYFAPEIASGKYSHRSDVYSYGVVSI